MSQPFPTAQECHDTLQAAKKQLLEGVEEDMSRVYSDVGRFYGGRPAKVAPFQVSGGQFLLGMSGVAMLGNALNGNTSTALGVLGAGALGQAVSTYRARQGYNQAVERYEALEQKLNDPAAKVEAADVLAVAGPTSMTADSVHKLSLETAKDVLSKRGVVLAVAGVGILAAPLLGPAAAGLATLAGVVTVVGSLAGALAEYTNSEQSAQLKEKLDGRLKTFHDTLAGRRTTQIEAAPEPTGLRPATP